jgi:transcriptional regulator with XRE-family HTH domain
VRKTVNNEKIKAFGKQFAACRKSQGVTQEELAHRTGISLSQIARIETGVINTSLNTLLILAEGLGVSPARIFEEKE